MLGWAWKGLDRVQSQTASRFSRVGMKIVGYEKAGCSEICVNGNKILRINRKTLIDQNIEGAAGSLA